MTMSDVAINFEDVTKTYTLYDDPTSHIAQVLGLSKNSKGKKFNALQNINATIRKGERIGLVGRNGAGKTTLLKLLIGHVKPSSGNLVVSGNVHAMMKADLGFHAHFTGRQNVMSALAYSNINGHDALDRLEDILDFTELGAYIDQPFMNYSLGMQSRLMFAVATAVKPDILIVDEMLGAGDAYFSSKSAKRMQNLIDHGCTLLLVSHNTQQVMQFCDKAIWLRQGQIYDQGNARDVVNSYDVYIERETERRHNGLQVSDKTDSRSGMLRINREEFKDTLADGKKVFRWPSTKGVKIMSADFFVDGSKSQTLYSSKNNELHFDIKIEETKKFSCRYMVTIWDLKGKRIARLENHHDTFDGVVGKTRPVRICLDPLQIHEGHYTVSMSIYDMDNYTSTAEGRMTRLDVIAHCLDFNIVIDDLNVLQGYKPSILLQGNICTHTQNYKEIT